MGPRFLICISISVNTIIGIVMSQLMIPVEVALGGVASTIPLRMNCLQCVHVHR